MGSPSASASEGEIVEIEMDKASLAQSTMRDRHVDRRSRKPASASASSNSPEAGDVARYRSRSRSPYRRRSPRGEKRRRTEDHNGDRDRNETRRFKVRYEDPRRNRVSYADLDRGDSYPSRADTRSSRDLYRDRRQRSHSRSRSPYSSRREHERRREDHTSGSRAGSAARSISPRRSGKSRSTAATKFKDGANRSSHIRPSLPHGQQVKGQRSNHTASSQISNGHGSQVYPMDNAGQPEAELGEVDEVAQIEARRKRREALKAKLKSQPIPLLVQALHVATESGPSTPQQDASTPGGSGSGSPVIGSPKSQNAADSPTAFIVNNDDELANHNQSAGQRDDADRQSAADYDPVADMQEDRARHDHRLHSEMASHDFKETGERHDILMSDVPPTDLEPSKKEEFDMFADDDDDMFASPPVTKTLSKDSSKPRELDAKLLDNWDDHEGYYRIIIGELIDGRYHVQANLGKGMFSSVVRAIDKKTDELVAIKIIRSNDTMRKAGMKEMDILQRLTAADPEGKKHVIRLERSFDHKNHLCMVFENLSINLREVLKKFGRDVGINIKAIRSYAQQMFLGLTLLRKCNILHADLKPDNILVNETRNVLKICDLGSAGDASDCEITPYLVSRFYRAPEIILGIPYDFGIDTWSVGCTLYEMYTGQILFRGRNNNQMLRAIMECRGKFSLKMLKRAEFAGVHFDATAAFRSFEKDKITGNDIVRTHNFIRPTKDLKALLVGAAKGLGESDQKELNLFADLLDRCLALNPEKRITPAEALKHPFIHRTKA